MSSTMKQQHDLPASCEPTNGSTSGVMHADARSDVEEPSDAADLASQTANLHLDDENTKPKPAPGPTFTTTSNDDPVHNSVDEDCDSGTEFETTNTAQNEQDTTASAREDDETNAGAVDDGTKDEYDTPRLSTYIKLNNEMMKSKTSLTTDTTELLELYHKASHIAHTLLESNEKHRDLPLVMHAHACLVLGCSDEDDCYERMQEALTLIKHAMTEGALGRAEGEAMLKTCEEMMGMREFLFSDEEKMGGDGEAGDEDNGESDDDEDEESEGENVDGELERNDALP